MFSCMMICSLVFELSLIESIRRGGHGWVNRRSFYMIGDASLLDLVRITEHGARVNCCETLISYTAYVFAFRLYFPTGVFGW